MKKIIFIFNLLLVTCLFAQKSQKINIQYGKQIKDCVPPEGKNFSIAYKFLVLKPGKRDSTVVKIRLPKKSDDLTLFNKGLENPNKLEVSCFPFLGGAKILALELGEPNINPSENKLNETIIINSNTKSNNIKNSVNGAEFCMSISALTNKHGKYVVELPIKAKVKLGILPAVWVRCNIKNMYFSVK